MSAADEVVSHAPRTGAGDHMDRSGGHHPTLRQYIIGFVLAIILTVIPFALVIGNVKTDMLAVIAACAAAQIIVHAVYFLHLNRSAEQHWNRLALLYVMFMIVIVIGGSVWIMHSLDYNMMPDMGHVTVWK
jgi:cytochrome o ubiquinol oxidase operon protein cyoD